ncbi:MAG: aminomethyl-transferring glycine dehydrogenase subunit GcvPB [Thermodesulfobacteriota bacterium]|nr:aminomethyl-transferring glycine dehydrogenase subunit GcvPB [Thermodesulfobacteriota bacterium]
MPVIFDKSVAARRGVRLPKTDVPVSSEIDSRYARSKKFDLCELSELDVVRHFTDLSKKNFGVDTNFYPLGSCTMKYNPKVCEKIAQLDGFSLLHPLLPQLRRGGLLTQGALAVIYELEQLLCEITGMDAFTLQPLAGAHGELTGMMLVAAYQKSKQNRKSEVLIPDEAHGTNPSSAYTAGYTVKEVPTNRETGAVDLSVLESMMGEQTAALMLTNPNTLGIFISEIEKISELARRYNCLLYYDGANLNAVLGRFRPGDALFDIVHVNLHKTFGTPHGGGGPGAGPVGVKKHLERFLPISRVIKRDDNTYALNYDYPDSIGYVAPFYGNFAVCLKAYAYILLLGKEGLLRVSENAVLNANYILHSLKKAYYSPYPDGCMHECVLSAQKQLKKGVRAIDIAKALIDEGFHPPTIYFPQIVKEALMIEPTETESKETLDTFIEAMIRIAKKADKSPDKLHLAPQNTPVGRLNEVKAAREIDLSYNVKDT